ncbi:hypothetical protein ACVIGA_006161 [Bradyrhizobium sp. USDA 3240]
MAGRIYMAQFADRTESTCATTRAVRDICVAYVRDFPHGCCCREDRGIGRDECIDRCYRCRIRGSRPGRSSGTGRPQVPGVIGDFLEAFRPVAATAGVDIHLFMGEVDLDAIAIEFDLVHPAFAAGHPVDRRSQCRRNEARKQRLDADRRRLFCAGTACLNQTERQLPPISTRMAIDKGLQVRRNVGQLEIAAALDLSSDVL